ncbi:hypothetical protein LCGC14_2180900 [marine sediment metagenome]|uniref:Uncharacterized protein n=1 Tax=marine sediment metagenome TaxID=412755 RepID=A0A0F9DMG1_9ZZZZ
MIETLWLNGATLALVALVLGVIFRMLARLRVDTSATAKDIYVQLTNFRVEVAKEYATNSYLKEVETRIMARLDSIERLVRNSVKK